MTLYFLGGGNMAAAIIAAWQQHGDGTPVVVAERNAERRNTLMQRFGIHTLDTLPALQADDVLVLAVKPQDMAQACADVQHGGALVLSIAAGLPVAALSAMLGGTQRIIRIMPNTPAAVGMGMSGLYAADAADAADRARAEILMNACGRCLWLENEAQMHALTAVSGSGPAYVFYLLNALQQSAQHLGFTPEQAHTLALETFRGATALAAASPDSFAALQEQVTSKGGTTYAALESFRANELAKLLEQGVQAAAARSREMAEKIESTPTP